MWKWTPYSPLCYFSFEFLQCDKISGINFRYGRVKLSG